MYVRCSPHLSHHQSPYTFFIIPFSPHAPTKVRVRLQHFEGFDQLLLLLQSSDLFAEVLALGPREMLVGTLGGHCLSDRQRSLALEAVPGKDRWDREEGRKGVREEGSKGGSEGVRKGWWKAVLHTHNVWAKTTPQRRCEAQKL